QTANLTGWPEIRNEVEFSQLVSGIRTHAGGVRDESSDQPGAQKEPRRRAVGTLRVKYAVRTDRARTAYAVMGDGPVLVIPPGGTTHIEWYTADTEAHEKFCARLAEHRTLVLYDRHGFGLSDRNRTDFTTEDDLKDLEAVIEMVGAPTFDFFGISWGGGPTLAYAAMHPERVRKIVLYGTGSAGRAGPSEEVVATNKSLAALRRADWELYTKTRALQYFPSGTDAETFTSFGRMLRDSTTPEMAEKLEGIHLETQSLLAGISVPALILHRRGDQCAKFEWGQYLARRLPNASFIPLDGDAHFPWVDDADSVLTPTIEFLTSA
ncbi:MAG: alpha/beta hydrolase, partial [Gemmatimonadetes bacterium]|nr:alpha/beta hydrolase [Gemmatimonadota bacterium]